MHPLIVPWCNGSTTVFGSVSGGSSPSGTTLEEVLSKEPLFCACNSVKCGWWGGDKVKVMARFVGLPVVKARGEGASEGI